MSGPSLPSPAALWISWPLVPLATAASAAGLFLPGVYRDPPSIVPALRGQDAVTLVALPVMAGAMVAAGRGSTRATIELGENAR